MNLYSNLTPGPWEARTGRANTSVYAGATAVAVGCREADGKAIAALPALIAALQDLISAVENGDEDSLFELTAARAALAKAGVL